MLLADLAHRPTQAMHSLFAIFVGIILFSVYSATGDMVDVSDFICCTYMHIQPHLDPLHIWHVCELGRHIFSGICVAVIYEKDVIGCVLAHMHQFWIYIPICKHAHNLSNVLNIMLSINSCFHLFRLIVLIPK